MTFVHCNILPHSGEVVRVGSVRDEEVVAVERIGNFVKFRSDRRPAALLGRLFHPCEISVAPRPGSRARACAAPENGLRTSRVGTV